jgi:hypothetical protein
MQLRAAGGNPTHYTSDPADEAAFFFKEQNLSLIPSARAATALERIFSLVKIYIF